MSEYELETWLPPCVMAAVTIARIRLVTSWMPKMRENEWLELIRGAGQGSRFARDETLTKVSIGVKVVIFACQLLFFGSHSIDGWDKKQVPVLSFSSHLLPLFEGKKKKKFHGPARCMAISSPRIQRSKWMPEQESNIYWV
jgi:hypothetical protein